MPRSSVRSGSHPRVLRKPWTSGEAWRFVATLLESPGFAMLVPTSRPADVAERVLG